MRMDALVQRIVVVLAIFVALLACFAWCEHDALLRLAHDGAMREAQYRAESAEERVAMMQEIGDLRAAVVSQEQAIEEQRAQSAALRVRAVSQDAFVSTVDRFGDRTTALEQQMRDERAQMSEMRGMIVGVCQDFTRLTSAMEGAERRITTVDESAEKKMLSLQDTMSTVKAKIPLQRDTVAMSHEMIAPTVQVMCDREVGSGTIITSRTRADGGYDTYVLTALHVVEGAVGKSAMTMVVTTYSEGTGDTRESDADLIAYKAPVDLALLKVRSRDRFPFVARIAPRSTLSAIGVFARVYAVGCPLGYPPLPTFGELSSKTKVLAGETYWMLNAPTIFGNSGGGIYLAETHELIGVLSRVSAYNNFVNIAVPHMGIFIPGGDIIDFLDEQGMQFFHDASAETAKEAVSAKEGTSEHVPPVVEDTVRPALK
ncbi:trypsin-like peptidase domain-containing protein [Candidatus Uhrbacteria bacterium]|nr:trypsin-like peptidase domain-containing protein [Candidatus Uhrbacteria bacterium]